MPIKKRAASPVALKRSKKDAAAKPTKAKKPAVKATKYDYSQAIEKSENINKLWSGKLISALVKESVKFDATLRLEYECVTDLSRKLVFCTTKEPKNRYVGLMVSEKLPKARPNGMHLEIAIPALAKTKSTKKYREIITEVGNTFCRLVHDHGLVEWACILGKGTLSIALNRLKK